MTTQIYELFKKLVKFFEAEKNISFKCDEKNNSITIYVPSSQSLHEPNKLSKNGKREFPKDELSLDKEISTKKQLKQNQEGLCNDIENYYVSNGSNDNKASTHQSITSETYTVCRDGVNSAEGDCVGFNGMITHCLRYHRRRVGRGVQPPPCHTHTH